MDAVLEYALIAASAYQHARSGVNRILPPAATGWGEAIDLYTRDESSGFEAKVFRRVTASKAEIVIAFTGTDEVTDWTSTNFQSFLGWSTESIKQAAALYARVVAENPGAQVSFTGHSLGGGLAALMGVFFGEKAVTFDQAPFRASASESIRDGLLAVVDQFVASTPTVTQEGLTALQAMRSKLAGFSSESFKERESLVTDHSVVGAVQWVIAVSRLSKRIGNPVEWLDDGSSSATSLALQSISLLVGAAFMTKSSGNVLREAW